MASKGQTAKIHTLLSVLDLDNETYREILSNYGVSTSKALTFQEAGEVIDRLEAHALCTGRWQKKDSGKSKRYENLKNREDMATPAQLRNIEGLWFDVTRQGTRAEGLKALRTFLSNHFGISDITFLTDKMVTKTITTLKAMKKQSVKQAKPNSQKKKATEKTSECKVYSISDFRRNK